MNDFFDPQPLCPFHRAPEFNRNCVCTQLNAAFVAGYTRAVEDATQHLRTAVESVNPKPAGRSR